MCTYSRRYGDVPFFCFYDCRAYIHVYAAAYRHADYTYKLYDCIIFRIQSTPTTVIYSDNNV